MRDKERTRLQSKSKVYFLLFGTKFSILELQESMTGKKAESVICKTVCFFFLPSYSPHER